MVILGCTMSGNLDDSRFNEPVPWVGVYVAAASAACAFAMAVDALHSICDRKFWFPCKFFCLNATTLTLMNVATKMSVDLNTPMPRRQDQLVKLSSAALICTVMGNFLPSLGTVENRELLMNIIALGILILTVIVNTCIQLGTGVIYMFRKEHIAVMYLMLVLLVIFISSALTIPTIKSYFGRQYRVKYEDAMREYTYVSHNRDKKLRDDLTRFWTMAHTGSPQFVMGRLVTCTASGAVCLLSTVILSEAVLRCYLMPIQFCHGESDYKWSSTVILVAQFSAIGVGSIAPACRWLNNINLRRPKKPNESCKPDFKVEKYWIRRLKLWKEYPLVLGVYCWLWRMLVQNTKDKFMGFCIWMQIAIVLFSKLILLISIHFVCLLLIPCHHCRRLIKWMKCKITNSILEAELPLPTVLGPDPNLKYYVLHLEGEENLIGGMMKRNYDDTYQQLVMGRKKQPEYLVRLLEEKKPLTEFEGVWKFDSDQVPSLDRDFAEPPNCWALPVVTLTSIAIALSTTDFYFVKILIKSIKEGMSLIRTVEENLYNGGLTNIRKAADMVWLGVDLKYQWLGTDLREMALQNKGSKAVLKELAAAGESKVKRFLKKNSIATSRETPSKWPIHVLAANSMYRICTTLLLNLDCTENNRTIIKRLFAMITDIMVACLTNLRRVITNQSQRSTIEEREESVNYALFLLGKTEKLLCILDRHPLPDLGPDQLAYIDEWRALRKSRDHLQNNSSSSITSEVCVTIE